MTALKLVMKEIKCDENGKGWVTIAGLARLADVQYIQAQRFAESLTAYKAGDKTNENNELPVTEIEIYISDIDAVTYISKQAIAGNGKAALSLSQFAAIGLRTMIQMESGYNLPKNNSAELAELKRQLAFCSIKPDTPKAVFEQRSNKKVSLVYDDLVSVGFIVKRKRMVEVIDYLLTPEGSKHLYFEKGQIMIKKESHHDIRLIAHGARLATTGQSDLFN